MNLSSEVFLVVSIVFILTYLLYLKFKKQKILAINGYDLVAYFEINQAVKGKKEYRVFYKTKTYYFSSQGNKENFIKNQEYYLPQYDGFCSHGMSNGYKASTHPQAFTIYNDNLYLNYNLKYREDWLIDKEERIKRADANWAKFMSKIVCKL